MNYGAPPAGYKPWRPTETDIKAGIAKGRITEAAIWDNMTPEQRKLVKPELNPNKRWFEQ